MRGAAVGLKPGASARARCGGGSSCVGTALARAAAARPAPVLGRPTLSAPRRLRTAAPVAAAAGHAGPPVRPPPLAPLQAGEDGDTRLRRGIWTAIDVVSLLGSVAGALAALLGVVSPTYALVLPLVLPVVSLVAALQREDLVTEVRGGGGRLGVRGSAPAEQRAAAGRGRGGEPPDDRGHTAARAAGAGARESAAAAAPDPSRPYTPCRPSQDNRAYLSRLSSSLQGGTGALLREARAAVEDVRRELSTARGSSGPGGAPPLPLGPRLAALEGKLGVIEGALLSAGAQPAFAQPIMLCAGVRHAR